MTQYEFDLIFNEMCSNWDYINRDETKKNEKALLMFSRFRYMSRFAFGEIIDELINDTERKDMFPTVAMINKIVKKNKPKREKIDCAVCNGVGLVSMLHVFKLPIEDIKQPAYVRFADLSVEIDIRNDDNLTSYSYAYSCRCANAIDFPQKRITQDQFEEIKKYSVG